MNVCACVWVHCASFMIDVSCKKKVSCIKTAIILIFRLFFCYTSVRQCGDFVTYYSHCHHAHCLRLHNSLIHWCHIFHWWSCCTYPIYSVFHNIKHFENYYSLNATHAVLHIVFLQKKMNKLHDWNPCQCKNDIHLFFKCWWWIKWVAYQVQWTNRKEFLIVWQCIR